MTTETIKTHHLHSTTSNIYNGLIDLKDNSDVNQNPTQSSNQLPINLFYTSSQYAKLLITNGKSIQKKDDIEIQGFHNGLEFLNQNLFEENEQKQLSRKINMSTQQTIRKRGQSSTVECCCCCCDQFCKLCADDSEKCQQRQSKKLTSAQLSQAINKVEKKIKDKRKKKRKIIQFKKKQKNSHKEVEDLYSQKSKSNFSYLSQKKLNIQNLVCHSLIQFQEKKREEKISKIKEKHEKEVRRNFMTELNNQIKAKNREESLSKSLTKLSKSKKITQTEKRINYWNSIKDDVAKQIIKSKLSGSLSKNSLLKIKRDEVSCDHKPKLTSEMITQLKDKHEKQAKKKLKKEKIEKSKEKKKIEKNLKEVIREQRKTISELPKRKFKPSVEMIENAFVDKV